MTSSAEIVLAHILERLETSRPLIVGICGAQGSGKTWLTSTVADRLGEKGLRCATLSIDDLYLSRARRADLAREVHPLLAVRGVPGTHDVGLGISLLDALKCGEGNLLPVFDKARDDLLPQTHWQRVDGPFDVVLFEGWCVGARPEPEAALALAVNTLEAADDADSRWRHYANDCLATEYQTLFERIDTLVLLRAPGFEVVAGWREQQEHALRRSIGSANEDTAGLMDTAAIARFVMFYERLTRHILAEMPSRADLTIDLDRQRNVIAVRSTRAG